MVKERELYLPILELFGEEYFSAEEVSLGPKSVDLVLMSRSTDKVIAIEVKTRAWKRALRQALNYQLAADESYVAITKKHSNSIDYDQFRRLGIGLILVDLDANKADIEIPAKQSTRKGKNYATLMKAELAEREAKQNHRQKLNPTSSTSLKHYLWYVANERRYYDEFPDCYDGFVINAHVLAHYASAFSALCLKLDKPFLIIPDTHFFQLAPSSYFWDAKGGIRSSWEKLTDGYGPLLRLALYQGRELEQTDFLSATGSWRQAMYDLVENVITFQKRIVLSAASGLARFIDTTVSEPTYLVAPYFFFSDVKDPWYKISVEMARESAKYKESHKLFALLCTSKKVVMDEQAISTIVTDYSEIGMDGFLLWIQDFNEIAEIVPLLYSLRRFIEVLKENNCTVINLYGEFFSSLMFYYGLDGACYGVCYKQTADPEEFPTSTGGPPGGRLPKYYFKDLKMKMGKIEAAIVTKAEPSLKCSCSICASQLDFMLDGATRDVDSRDLMKRHFLLSRKEEKDHISTHTLKQVLSELQSSRKKYEKRFSILNVEHLKRWIAACKTKA